MSVRPRVGPVRSRAALVVLAGLVALIGTPAAKLAPVEPGSLTLTIRGQPQLLRTYGTRGGDPVIVSSGDGGWVHVAPHVAGILAAHGCYVIGVDVKRYLEQFTTASATLRAEDVPGDYAQLAAVAALGAPRRPVLIGVSEGAGLSILAAGDRRIQAAAAGVIAIGLPAVSELGWRWRDSVIYLTHGVPNEPSFSTARVIGQVAPLPLAAIHSTHDEFLPIAEARALVEQAGGPTRFLGVSAADHRFSDNLPELDTRVLEAMTWIRQNLTH